MGWLVASGLVCTIDALFVLLRPLTLPGGSLGIFPFSLWHQYIIHDKRYASMTDGWVRLQSIMNVVEIFCQFLCVFLSKRGNYAAAHKLCAVLSASTAYKTVIYFGVEIFDGFPFTKHNNNFDFYTMVVIPSSFWILFPVICMMQSLSKLTVKSKAE